MPGNQPNMPCTHYQQLSRQKLSSGPVDSINVLYHTGWTNRGNLHTILDLTLKQVNLQNNYILLSINQCKTINIWRKLNE